MKRIIFVIVSFVLLFMVLSPVTALAAEVVDELSSGESTYHDIFTRVWEYVEENKSELISAAGSAVVLIFSAITNATTKAVNTKKNKEITDKLAVIGSDASGTANSQTAVIGAVNTMVKGYNEMREAYEKNASAEDDRNRLVGACLVMSSAVLEMMNAVFAHNKNTPQGVKDFVILQYVNCQKVLSDDELLCQVVEFIREKINTEAVVENDKQD